MSHELRTVVVLDTGHERHRYDNAVATWREDESRKFHSAKVAYEDQETGEVETDSIYGGRILYDGPNRDCDVIPSVEELIEDTTVVDDSYWGKE